MVLFCSGWDSGMGSFGNSCRRASMPVAAPVFAGGGVWPHASTHRRRKPAALSSSDVSAHVPGVRSRACSCPSALRCSTGWGLSLKYCALKWLKRKGFFLERCGDHYRNPARICRHWRTPWGRPEEADDEKRSSAPLIRGGGDGNGQFAGGGESLPKGRPGGLPHCQCVIEYTM